MFEKEFVYFAKINKNTYGSVTSSEVKKLPMNELMDILSYADEDVRKDFRKTGILVIVYLDNRLVIGLTAKMVKGYIAGFQHAYYLGVTNTEIANRLHTLN